MSNLDNILRNKYRKIFGLDTIMLNTESNVTNDTVLTGNISITTNLNVPLNTIINNTLTIKSSLNSNNLNILGSTTCLANLINLNNSIYNNDTTILSNLYSSSNSILNNISLLSNLYVNNLSIKCISLLSNLYISNNSILQNANIWNYLNISNNSIFNSDSTIISNLNISNTTLLGYTSILNNLSVSGNTIFKNSSTINSIFNVIGTSTINNISLSSNLNVNNNAILNNSIINNSMTSLNNFNISGYSYLANLNILGKIIGKLSEYPDNDSAILGGIPLWGFYRTGGIIKIVIPTIPQVITLNGYGTMNVTLYDTFVDPGVTIIDSNNYTINIIGTISTQKVGSYIRYYNAIDNNNNIINSLIRTIYVIS